MKAKKVIMTRRKYMDWIKFWKYKTTIMFQIKTSPKGKWQNIAIQNSPYRTRLYMDGAHIFTATKHGDAPKFIQRFIGFLADRYDKED